MLAVSGVRPRPEAGYINTRSPLSPLTCTSLELLRRDVGLAPLHYSYGQRFAYFKPCRKTGVLNRLKKLQRQTVLPGEVLSGLQTANLICPENVAVAIKSLTRGSTPGEDDMSLDFFLEPVLSLY